MGRTLKSATVPVLLKDHLAQPKDYRRREKIAPSPARTGQIDFSNGRWRRLGDPSWCMQQSVRYRPLKSPTAFTEHWQIYSPLIKLGFCRPRPLAGGLRTGRALAICLPMLQTLLAPDWRPATSPAWLSLPGRRCSQSVLRHRPSQVARAGRLGRLSAECRTRIVRPGG
jgi:hypothetical protein